MTKAIPNTSEKRSSILTVTLVVAGILFGAGAYGQLITVPLKRGASTEVQAKKKATPSLRRKSDTPLSLPFWDDFSFTRTHYSKHDTVAGYPLDSLWEGSEHVWITSGVEVNAPTLNVATFDGLDSIGNKYAQEPLSNGFRDTLTSRPIDLSEPAVSIAERPSVYLSFFYQWRGNGEPPDALDNLRVDFYNKNKQWIPVATLSRPTDPQADEFLFAVIKVEDPDFFHQKFRFRFRNYGRLSGPFDTWNLDYVYLNKGRTSEDRYFSDGAIASLPGPLFDKYYAVPYQHFLEEPVIGDLTFDVFNLRAPKPAPDAFGYRFDATFTSWTEGVRSVSNVLLSENDRPLREPDDARINSMERVPVVTWSVDRPDAQDVAQFDPAADSVLIDAHIRLIATDNGRFEANDTVSARYALTNYYAYDDGSAEYAVGLSNPDDQVAVRFVKLGPTSDKLSAIDIYIPKYNLSGFQTAEFIVLNEVDGLPADVISSVTQVIRRTDRNVFQRILLTKPVQVEGGFFIGWKGSFTSTLFVGKDAETNSADRIYVKPFAVWQQNTNLEGSIMIRPVFGDTGPVNGIEGNAKQFMIYPNPTEGTFFIGGIPDKVEITSVTGQDIEFTQERQDDRIQISVQRTTPGVYIVRTKKGSKQESHKIILR